MARCTCKLQILALAEIYDCSSYKFKSNKKGQKKRKAKAKSCLIKSTMALIMLKLISKMLISNLIHMKREMVFMVLSTAVEVMMKGGHL